MMEICARVVGQAFQPDTIVEPILNAQEAPRQAGKPDLQA